MNYSTWSGRLREASHLARYIITLQLDFPGMPADSDMDSFQDVLAHLTNVQRFRLDGTLMLRCSDLPLGVSAALLDFIFRQRLRRLDISHMLIPAAMLSALQTAVLTLRLCGVRSFIREPIPFFNPCEYPNLRPKIFGSPRLPCSRLRAVLRSKPARFMRIRFPKLHAHHFCSGAHTRTYSTE